MRLLFIGLLLFASAAAQQAPSNSEMRAVKVPARPLTMQPPPKTLKQALEIAEKYITNHKIDIGRYWLREARLVPSKDSPALNDARWFFLWVNLTGTAGDYVEIFVDMNGQAVRQPSV